MDDPTLQRFARLTQARPEFWAWVFDHYDQSQGPHAGSLAEHLGLSARDLLRLGLYLRPREDHFEADVTRAAAAFGIDRFRLADVARFVNAVETVNAPSAAPPSADSGLLLAARSRKKRGGEKTPGPQQAPNKAGEENPDGQGGSS